MTTKPTETCANCRAYRAFYRAGFFCFFIDNEGICIESGKIVKCNESCKLYEKPPRLPEITPLLIDKAIADAEYILNYFENDN